MGNPHLWFQISWGELIIIPFIMVMLRFNLQSFYLNLTLNLFHIRTPLQSNQSIMMKWTSSWNYSTQRMMMIFWMLTSRCFSIDWCSLLIKNFIQSLLCCLMNIEEQMLQSQILYHTFLCSPKPRPLWNWITETRYMPNELRLLNLIFLTVPLYIQWDQFIIVQVTLPTPSHQVP